MGCAIVAGRGWRGAWMLAWLLACAWPLRAGAQSLSLSVFETVGTEAAVGDVLAGKFAGQFRPRPTGDVLLRGSPSHVFWLRLEARAPAGQPWVLVFDRVALDRIALFLPRGDGTWSRPADGFFDPLPDGTLSPDRYAFALPPLSDAPRVFYVQVRGALRMNLAPRLLGEAEFRAGERRLAMAGGAAHAALLVLMLSALAMYLALRERAYAGFAAFTGGVLVALAALGGTLYRLPGLGWFGAWGSDGLHALVLACGVLALGFTRHFLDLARRDARADRRVRRAQWLLGLVAAGALLAPDTASAQLQALAAGLAVATALGIVGLALQAARRGERVGRAYALVWSLVTLVVALRAAVALGWLPPWGLLVHGFAPMLVFAQFLMSIGLADRVMDYRRQRDHAHQLRQQTDASLQVEQVRREFADGLREQLRNTPPGGDLEWVAFRRVLGALRQVLPQQGAAVVAFGYHGIDLLLCEPMDAKERYEGLLAARGGTIKGLCRSRSAVQARLDEQATPDGPLLHPEGGLFAVVPMAMPVPGWGALLIERAPWEAFDAAELKLAADFLRQAVAATDEAVGQARLREKAELDPLTGADNRRHGDALLDAAMRRAIGERKPLSVLIADLDHFRQINERHGPAVGDDCLRACADALRAELAPGETLVRHGGEEFLVMLPGVAPDAARQRAERLRAAVAQARVAAAQGTPVRITVSIGIAGRWPDEEHAAGIVERAQKALQTAKRSGRNQVQVAPAHGHAARGEEPPPPLAL